MDRKELHRRLELLRSKMKNGKFHVAAHLADDFQQSLSKIRLSSDGLVDESTVDGRIRSTLIFIAYQADRDEWKEAVSLQKIQEAYFDRLERVFGEPFQGMLDADVDPYHFAEWYASDKQRVRDTIEIADEFVSNTLEFWENISEPTWIHLQDSFDTKAVFTGEIFPDGKSNIVSSTGIYFDTTILPDPFVKMSPVLALMDEQERLTEILRLALQVLKYKEMALVDLPKPLVAILPDRYGFEEEYKSFVLSCAENDAVKHASRLFGRTFKEVEELAEYLRSFRSSDELVQALAHPKELVFATEWAGTLSNHIDQYIRENEKKLSIQFPGQAVFMQLLSRFSQANDSYQRSRDLHGTPILRAETSWMWFSWLLRNSSQSLETDTLTNLHISRALGTTVNAELSWLGNVPPAALIEIRKVGALDEIRGLLSAGVQELTAARPDNFFRTGDKVFENLHEAFLNHEKNLNSLRIKKWKFAGLDIGSFMVVGGIEMAAAFTGVPLYGAAAASASLSGAIPTAKDLKERLAKLREESAKLDSTGVGILFRHKK